jgi:quercetin dioxygenase-like cupin family protein
VPVFRSASAPVFTASQPGLDPKIPTPHLTVRGYAAPSRGAKEVCAWHATFAPGVPQTPGTLTHEWYFLVLSGVASVELDGTHIELEPGDSMTVPANVPVSLGNPHDEQLELLEVCPVGTQLAFPGMDPFTPQWVE